MNINFPSSKPKAEETAADESKRIAAEKREFHKDIKKRRAYLAKLGSSEATPEEGLGKILKTLRTTKDEYMFFAAVEWCVKTSSAYYDKRNPLLASMVRNYYFRESSSVGTVLKYYKNFNSEIIKDLLKKHKSINANSAVRSMSKMNKSDIAALAKYMPGITKRKFVAKANSLGGEWVDKVHRESDVRSADYTKKANSYQKVVEVLNASLRGKEPAIKDRAEVKRTPFNQPARPKQKPPVVQIKNKDESI